MASQHQLPSLPQNAVWFISGTSSGIGLSLITSILSTPGHRIVALSRNPSSIHLPPSSNPQNTLLQPVDLRSASSITSAFEAALSKFGRIDVVINNAGHGLFGEFESSSDDAARDLFEINYWAPVQITRQAMGIMRDVNSKTGPIGGVVAQVSSIWGYIGFAGQTAYHGSKFALEGFTEAVAKELDPEWNVRFAVFEPGSVKTKWSNANMVKDATQHEAYAGKSLGTDQLRDMNRFEGSIGAEPSEVANLIRDVLARQKGRWDGKEILRLAVGADAFALLKTEALAQVKNFDDGREISESTSSGEVKKTLKASGLIKD